MWELRVDNVGTVNWSKMKLISHQATSQYDGTIL